VVLIGPHAAIASVLVNTAIVFISLDL